MDVKLTEEDKNTIWQIVHHAAEGMGGYHQLFASPLEFSEDDNRVHFNWPIWMRAIKAYVINQYGEKALEFLLLDILAEIYNPENYRRYLNRLEQPAVQPAANASHFKFSG